MRSRARFILLLPIDSRVDTPTVSHDRDPVIAHNG
jgi:hypothetical protein